VARPALCASARLGRARSDHVKRRRILSTPHGSPRIPGQALFEERGERFTASVYTFELHEPDLLVVGHRRIRSKKGLRGDYLYFVHGFRDGRVCRLSAHRTREAALVRHRGIRGRAELVAHH
jgi:hypothetical protein